MKPRADIWSNTASRWRFTATRPACSASTIKNAAGGDGQAQFGRAMNELHITGICANTSSAKGRVEHAHLTLLDRLVKEIRLREISMPDATNAFAAELYR